MQPNADMSLSTVDNESHYGKELRSLAFYVELHGNSPILKTMDDITVYCQPIIGLNNKYLIKNMHSYKKPVSRSPTQAKKYSH